MSPVRLLLAALCLVVAAAALAQPYDPAYRWRTLETPHFRIHHHQGEEALAADVARAAERAHAALVPLLGHAPRRGTEVVLSDDVDDANGSATPLPYPTMRLFAVPPDALSELNDYRDWLDVLVFHEYVHVLHLDNVGGFPRTLNGIFGRVFFPNGLVPPWITEGVAILHENDGGARGAGRNASAIHDMYARTLVVEGAFPRLDEVSNPSLEWPIGNLPYLLGGRFWHWLRARSGEEKVRGFLRDQGSQIWPWAPSWAAERWFQADFPTLWREYAQAEETRFAAQLAAVRGRPVTRPAPVTTAGGRVIAPRWSPDGSFLLYTQRTLDRRPGLFRVTPDGRDRRRVANVESNGAVAVLSPREAVVAEGQVHREFRVYDDLWRVDLATGAKTRLTRGARATDPAVTKDGATLVYVRRTGPGAMALVRRPLAGGEEEILFSRGGAQVFSPAPSPDGRRVAFELHADGRRDLALWEDGKVTRITDDDALDTSPAWSPDGGHLLFAADRGGIFNLYAWETEGGAIRQVTNMESGAFQPQVSPDGRTLALVTYGRQGYDLATIPFEPGTWTEATEAEKVPGGAASATATSTEFPLAPSEAPPEAARSRGAPDPSPTDLAALPPSRPYSPWRTLVPTFWLPVVSSDSAGPTYGALTAGQDALARHAYILQAWWSTEAETAGYSATYLGGWSWPALDLSSSRAVESAPGPSEDEVVWTPLDAGLSFSFTRLDRALVLRAGWAGTYYDATGAGGRAGSAEGLATEDGFLSEATLRAVYTDARRFVRSISPEEGRTLALSVRRADPALGSDFGLTRGSASAAQYLRIPGTDHGVLALRLAGGLADGSIGARAPFRLGGAITADPVALLRGGPIAGEDALRGYEESALRGTGFVVANAELRFPIAAPARGYSTWPIFLRRIHGAVFADLGDAFDRPGQLPFAGHRFAADQLRLGAGAELRLEVVLGYFLTTDVRLTVAHAFGRVFEGEVDAPGTDPVTVYLSIGPAF